MKRTPFKAKLTWKRLSPISAKRRKENSEYSKKAKIYLEENPLCMRCLKDFGKWVSSTQVHHKKGRGKLLLVQEFWAAVCSPCHSWIETEKEAATRSGWRLDRIGKGETNG